MKKIDPVLRFWPKVYKNGPLSKTLGTKCWVWTGWRNWAGYAMFHWNGRDGVASNFSYSTFIAPLKRGFQGNHKCHNRGCVRPDHLYSGTQSENIVDSVTVRTHRNSRKTECIHGHPFDEANTHIRKNGRRECRACNRTRALKLYYS